MPLEDKRIRTAGGHFGILVTHNAVSFLTDHNNLDEYWLKRILACLGALAMPAEGVDEHLESTIDRFNYYEEMAALPPSPDRPELLEFTADFAGFKPRPEFIIPE
jgi:hypothetical protein